jgi:hypothetical protein
VGVLEQIAQLPYVVFWLPGLVFVAVAGGHYWLSRPSPAYADAPAPIASAQPMAAPKPKDQRESSRREGNTVEVHVAAPANKKNPGIGNVLDRSIGGVRLALYHEVEVGVVLSIRPVHAENMVPWVDVEVRSCKVSQEIPGSFEVGCQYVKSPPYSIQLLFG